MKNQKVEFVKSVANQIVLVTIGLRGAYLVIVSILLMNFPLGAVAMKPLTNL